MDDYRDLFNKVQDVNQVVSEIRDLPGFSIFNEVKTVRWAYQVFNDNAGDFYSTVSDLMIDFEKSKELNNRLDRKVTRALFNSLASGKAFTENLHNCLKRVGEFEREVLNELKNEEGELFLYKELRNCVSHFKFLGSHYTVNLFPSHEKKTYLLLEPFKTYLNSRYEEKKKDIGYVNKLRQLLQQLDDKDKIEIVPEIRAYQEQLRMVYRKYLLKLGKQKEDEIDILYDRLSKYHSRQFKNRFIPSVIYRHFKIQYATLKLVQDSQNMD